MVLVNTLNACHEKLQLQRTDRLQYYYTHLVPKFQWFTLKQMRRQTNISVVKSCCLFSCGECMHSFDSILQSKMDMDVYVPYVQPHILSSPQHCSCCSVIFTRVWSLENKIEEATTVQSNSGSVRLGCASRKRMQTRRCSVTNQRKLSSADIPLEKTSDRKTGSFLRPGQNQNLNPDEP